MADCNYINYAVKEASTISSLIKASIPHACDPSLLFSALTVAMRDAKYVLCGSRRTNTNTNKHSRLVMKTRFSSESGLNVISSLMGCLNSGSKSNMSTGHRWTFLCAKCVVI